MTLDDLLSHASRSAGLTLACGDLSHASTRRTWPVRDGRYAVHDGYDWYFADFYFGRWQVERLRDPAVLFVWYGLNRDIRPMAEEISMQRRSSEKTVMSATDAGSLDVKACRAPSPHDDLEAWAREILSRMRSQVASSLAALAGEVRPSELCADEIDRASARSEYEAALNARESQQSRLMEIDHALRKLRAGEYGICEATGDEIPPERLEANPLARFTVEHQARLERIGAMHSGAFA